jgi:alkanesulfonate monooxygenase SsuD/methylene tetrahydromethanopterin reductase-like flavin-dependent oxidoreductase (luciferase family)
VLGSAIPLRDHPLTLAEEHAMIDVLSGGRLISGFVRGIGSEYHAFGVNPTFSHERFHEAHDLITAAWRDPGPFPFYGKHYRFNYVNLWPRPIQRPHPPIWVPSQGSQETIDFAAHSDRRYTYLQTFSPAKVVGKYLNIYRETAARYGYTAADSQLGWAVPVYVAETDAIAMREAEQHYQNFRYTFVKMPPEMLLPPGYTSRESLKAIALAKSDMRKLNSFAEAVEMGLVVVGSAATVRERFTAYWKEFGFGNLLTMLQFGTLPADLTEKSMRLFAADVLPALQKLGTRMPAVPAIA